MSSVTGLLKQLELQAANEDQVQVFETASKILEASASTGELDLAVLKKCLVALINMDNYQLAAKYLKKYPVPNEDDLVLERSYIYYKLNRSDELAKILAQDLKNDRGLLNLKAQFCYQQGHNDEALKVYRELIQTSEDDELLDLSVNERAVIAQSALMNDQTLGVALKPISADDESSYDLIFNNSIIALNDGNLDTAIELLQDARRNCEQTIDSYNEIEKFMELFPILLQTSYIFYKKGDTATSESLLNELLTMINSIETDDKLAKLLILNNLYAIKLAEKDVKVNTNIVYANLKFPQILKQVNLTKPQLQKLESNEQVLSLSNGKTNTSLLKTIGEIDFVTQDDVTIARRLFKMARKNQTDASLTLLAIQYNNSVEKFDNSLILIDNLISETPHIFDQNPTLITIQAYIYSRLHKDVTELLSNFASSIEDYDLSKRYNYNVFREVCFKLLSLTAQDQDLCIETAKKLYAVNPEDRLIGAIVKKDSSLLTPIDELVSGVDVDELLEAGFDEASKRQVQTRAKKAAHKVTKAKYQRHKKVPEHLVGKTVDAERWLPLKDRSYYKPKKGKKSNATQGGAADDTTEMNMASSNNNSSSSVSNNNTAKSKPQKKKGKKRH